MSDGVFHSDDNSKGISFLRFIIILLLLGLVVLYVTTKPLYDKYVEHSSPVIENTLKELTGLGVVPVLIPVSISDSGSGLDEVIVRVLFRGAPREVLRRSFDGEKEVKIDIPLNAEELRLSDGEVKLEIKAFDKSFWNNSSELIVPLTVDLKKPRVQVATVMHNVRVGGSQLLFYKASDDNLRISGVRVAGEVFRGFKAKLIDPIFSDPAMHAVLFSLPYGDRTATGGKLTPQVFAEDQVGNVTVMNFGYRRLPRGDRSVKISITDQFVGSIFKLYSGFERSLKNVYEKAKIQLPIQGEEGSAENIQSKINLVLSAGRELDDLKIRAILADRDIFEASVKSPFSSPGGGVTTSFGETLKLTRDNQVIGDLYNTGYEMRSALNDGVKAVADGVVLFTGEIGTYGNVVIIDHGASIASVTARLGSVTVEKGKRVIAGDVIGTAGSSGLARFPGFYFEIRLSGFPVDAREWWDARWFAGHVLDQISMAKRLLEVGFGVESGL